MSPLWILLIQFSFIGFENSWKQAWIVVWNNVTRTGRGPGALNLQGVPNYSALNSKIIDKQFADKIM